MYARIFSDYDVNDSLLPSFNVKVNPDESKTWCVKINSLSPGCDLSKKVPNGFVGPIDVDLQQLKVGEEVYINIY